MITYQAKILAHSICAITQKEIFTWELVYPRLVHSEFMTHKMLGKNASSSRAIPVSKVISMVEDSPATPYEWGKNQPGMQAFESLEGEDLEDVQALWQEAADLAVDVARRMDLRKAHKQVINRILEPFQWIKVVVTGTEWANFFWLRNHIMADPTLRHLARLMAEEREMSTPTLLFPGDWHVPYFGSTGHWFKDNHNDGYTLQDALDISMSCCAQASYRTLDDTIEKAQSVVSKLNLGVDLDEPCHASPSEHQATPIYETYHWDSDYTWRDDFNVPSVLDSWQKGITAYHKELGFMSGNLAGYIQNRQLIKGQTRW